MKRQYTLQGIVLSLFLINMIGCTSGRSWLATNQNESPAIPQISFAQIEPAPQSVELSSKQVPDSVEEKIELTAGEEKESTETNKDSKFIPLPIVKPSSIAPIAEMPSQIGMTLNEFEQLALENNPTIKQLAASASQAQGFREQVGVLPNPTVGYSASQLADRGTDQHVFFIEQEFVRGDKLAINQRVLAHATQAQMWDVETQRYRVLTDIRLRYFEAAAAQKMQNLAIQFETITNKGVSIAKQRRKALVGSKIDVLQAQVQLNQIEIRRQQAEYAYQGAWKDLSAIAGMPYLVQTPLVDELRPSQIVENWEASYQSMLASSPELSAARSRVCEAKANLDRQKVQATPNLTVQLGAGTDYGTNSGLLNLQLSAPLPVYNKNQGNISAAYAKYCRATHEVKRIELAIKSRLAVVSKEYDSAKYTVKKYEEDIIPKAEETLTLSEQAYQAGELDYLQMLIVQRTNFEAKLKQILAVRDLAQADARIKGLLLTGGLDKPSEFNGDDALRGQTFSGQ